jgi:hypothetical protein
MGGSSPTGLVQCGKPGVQRAQALGGSVTDLNVGDLNLGDLNLGDLNLGTECARKGVVGGSPLASAGMEENGDRRPPLPPSLGDGTELSAQFVAALEDGSVAMAVDPRRASERAPALVCFGGIAGGMTGPPFEFLRLTEALAVHRIFVRDLNQCWYQRGLSGVGADVGQVAAGLDAMLHELGSSRRVFVGTSSGAFAAILFGVLDRADAVIAFSPQASLALRARIRCRDRRWSEQVKKARRNCVDPQHLDLVKLLGTHTDHGEIAVHYGRDDRLDAAHAQLLRQRTGVEAVAHPGGHVFVRDLRDSGQLEPLLRQSLGL